MTFDLHLAFDLIVSFATFGSFVVAIMIKNVLNEIKIQRLQDKLEYNKSLEDIVKHLAVHDAEDTGKFTPLEQALGALNSRVSTFQQTQH